MKISKLFLVLIFGFLSFSTPAGAMDANAQIERYIDIFNSDNISDEKKACNELQWAGLSSIRLFDLIEQKYKAIDTDLYDKVQLDLAAYYLKALSASGQPKYRETLQLASESSQKKIRRHGTIALNNLDKYNHWNKIISAPSASDPSGTTLATRFSNMLRSDEWELKRMASKRIYHDHINDDSILHTLNSELLNVYKNEISSKLEIDAVNWMMKALASSGKDAYRATLEEINQNGSHRKNRSYALGYIRKYME